MTWPRQTGRRSLNGAREQFVKNRCPLPGCEEPLSDSPCRLSLFAAPSHQSVPTDLGDSSLSVLFLMSLPSSLPPPATHTFVTLGKRTKGSLSFHKSGVEHLLFVMNPMSMSLINAASAIPHVSLAYQGNRF